MRLDSRRDRDPGEVSRGETEGKGGKVITALVAGAFGKVAQKKKKTWARSIWPRQAKKGISIIQIHVSKFNLSLESSLTSVSIQESAQDATIPDASMVHSPWSATNIIVSCAKAVNPHRFRGDGRWMPGVLSKLLGCATSI